MAFADDELDYLSSQPLARLATSGAEEQPDVVPVAFEYDGSVFWIGGSGQSVSATRKFLNVQRGRNRVALVIDDLVSLDPFIARGIRVYGIAGDPVERVGMVGPGIFLPITPTVSWSWNLAGVPVGETWYEVRRTDHDATA
jgi:pyridoxamine 5'-phosphate oxidase family protein